MNAIRLTLLMLPTLISASCGRDRGIAPSSIPTPPSSKATLTSRAVNCTSLWVVHNRTDPKKFSPPDQLRGDTFGEILHNNHVIIQGCGASR